MCECASARSDEAGPHREQGFALSQGSSKRVLVLGSPKVTACETESWQECYAPQERLCAAA